MSEKNPVYRGKSKDVYNITEGPNAGKYRFVFTDRATGAMSKDEIAQSVRLVQNIAEIVSQEFALKNLHVIDGKFELGRLKYGDSKIVLIDEISPDVLRICKGYSPDKSGNCTVYKQCAVTNYTHGKRTIKNKNQVSAADFTSIFL